MSYTKKTWVTNETIKAADLNNMENGIAAANAFTSLAWYDIGDDDVLAYYADADADPVTDTTVIWEMLLSNKVSPFVQSRDGMRPIIEIGPDFVGGIEYLAVAGGEMYVRQEDGMLHYRGEYAIAKMHDDAHDVNVLALISSRNDIMPDASTGAVFDYLEHFWATRWIFDTTSDTKRNITSYEFDTSITCGDGSSYVVQSIDDNDFLVEQPAPVTTKRLLKRKDFYDIGYQALCITDSDDNVISRSATDIFNGLLNGTLPWNIQDETGRNLAVVQVQPENTAPYITGVFDSLEDCYAPVEISGNVFLIANYGGGDK